MQTFCQPFLLYSACEAVSYLFLSPANSVSSASFYPQADRLPAMFLVDLPSCLSAFLLCLLMQFTGSADRLPPPPATTSRLPITPHFQCHYPNTLLAQTVFGSPGQARPFPLDQKCLSGSGFSSVPFFLRLRSPLSFVCECECVFMCCATFSCLSLGSSSSSSFFICIGSAISAIPTLVN